MITVITATGDRPLAFALCQHWMRNQTVQPNQWVVIDDGKVPTDPMVRMQYVRREPQPNDPSPTLILNLKTAFPLVMGDKVIIVEDDEYYSPGYVEEMSRQLDQHEIVGIMMSKYYHLPSGGYCVHPNTRHASLCATAFRSSFLPEVKEILNVCERENYQYLDMRMWPRTGPRGYLFADTAKTLYVGIKGMPGRSGICKGHDAAFYIRSSKDTADRETLRKWAPEGFRVYQDVLSGVLTAENYRAYFK